MIEAASPENVAAARDAGLRYMSDDQPGIHRRRRGRGFSYLAPSGEPLCDRATLEWIRALAIPPAWNDVWIAPIRNAHLLATGVDARGRKQYRYHPDWTDHRNRTKFHDLASFGAALPAIRRAVKRDLALRDHSKRHVVACAVRLIDDSLIRVGNEEYVEANDSYGVTTLRCEHVELNGRCFSLHFRAKGGRERDCECEDPLLTRALRGCEELPGQELFQYLDPQGEARPISSTDVNEYLNEVAGCKSPLITAKDFRTWGGTVIAMETFAAAGSATITKERTGGTTSTTTTKRRSRRSSDSSSEGGGGRSALLSERKLKSVEVAAVRAAAEALGNTPATCRKFYVHPQLWPAWQKGEIEKAFNHARKRRSPPELRLAERALLHWLERISEART